MALEVHKTKTKGKCTCFYFPETKDTEFGRLCFRKNFVGALDEEQIKEHCDLSKSDIYDAKSTKVQNLLRTMKQFQTGVSRAQKDYWGDDVKRDMDVWRDAVGRAVKNIEVEVRLPEERKVTRKDIEEIERIIEKPLAREIERTSIADKKARRLRQEELEALRDSDIRRIAKEMRLRQNYLEEMERRPRLERRVAMYEERPVGFEWGD